MTLNSLNGTECSTEIIKKINDIIAQKATISLSNLDSAGEQRFTTLAQGISDANDLITALTTVVGTKLSAEVSLQQNGYIKFSNRFQICYGTITASQRQTITTTFPKSFSTACRAISLEHSYDSSTTIGDGVSLKIILSGTPTASSFTWKTSGAGSNVYIAIGY